MNLKSIVGDNRFSGVKWLIGQTFPGWPAHRWAKKGTQKKRVGGGWRCSAYLDPALRLAEGLFTAHAGLLAPLHRLPAGQAKRHDSDEKTTQLGLGDKRSIHANCLFFNLQTKRRVFDHLAPRVAAHRWRLFANWQPGYRCALLHPTLPPSLTAVRLLAGVKRKGLRPLLNYWAKFWIWSETQRGRSEAEILPLKTDYFVI